MTARLQAMNTKTIRDLEQQLTGFDNELGELDSGVYEAFTSATMVFSLVDPRQVVLVASVRRLIHERG
jgi:hypothetical protein